MHLRGCLNNNAFTSAENHKAVAMGKTNIGSLENGKKITELDQKAPFYFLFSMNHKPTYYCFFFKIYPLDCIMEICRFLIDLTILTPSVKPNQSPISILHPEFLDWTDV